ncbi:unnamed protein product [Calypogeia fissa]
MGSLGGAGGGDESVILKPRTDEREYRRIVLHNGMQVLLVSDPDTDKAAAAMDVHIGSFSDPEELPGLAHFLEHMLFFSSEKYPEEDALFKFLVEHGGHSNAYTAPEHTNFHFEVSVDHLKEALDRFAQFFISPLFAPDAVSREIRAVDSENSKNITVDVWRMNQLARQLSSKDHPFHKFGTGNLETLEVRPKEKGVDTREELIKFYKARYSSNLMCLAVYGRESLDELQKLIEERFGEVRNTEKEVPRFPGLPCGEEHLQLLVRAVPVREGHSVMLVWPTTPEIQNYHAAPSLYLAHLIGHEADGSLFSLLKQQGWANSLSAGEVESTIDFAFFVVDIELTDVGQEHMEEVVGLTFQYLSILKKDGIERWIFEELQAVCDMKFHFQDKRPPVHYVTNLANSMQLYPASDWLAGPFLPRKFDSEVIAKAINELGVHNVRIFWHSKQFQSVASQVEPWYGTSYTVEKIDERLMKVWKSAEVDPRLHLPSANVFIPKDFSLIKVSEPKVQVPEVIRRSAMSRLWYKPDTKFSTPKACIKIHFNCPESNYSPEASVLTKIFTKLLVDYLNEYVYYAEVAGLSYKIQTSVNGFQVSVSGYNDKLIVLMEKVIEKIVNFEVDDDRFNIMMQKTLKDLLNFRFQQPYQQALYNCSLLIEHKHWHLNEYIEVLLEQTPDNLRLMVPHILCRVFMECYVAGNIASKDAETLLSHIETTLSQGPVVKSKPPFPTQLMEQRIVRLCDGANFSYLTTGLNPQDENSALQVYFQVGHDDTELNILIELFVLTAKEGAFHQLRTVEQLGYLVFLAPKNDFGVRGIQFIIQSTVKAPGDLDERVEAFLGRHAESLYKMTDEEFKRHVDSLIEMKLEKHKNLWEESSFFWGEIDDGTLKFNRPTIEVAALKKVDKHTLLSFFEEYIQRNAPKRKKLSLQVFGSIHMKEFEAATGEVHSDFGKESIHDDGLLVNGNGNLNEDSEKLQKSREAPKMIKDISSFKRAQSLYESLRGGLDPVYSIA